MAVSDWSTTAALNITVDGINIAEGTIPANLNNAIRGVMANVRVFYSSTLRLNENFYVIEDGDPDPVDMVEGDFVFRYEP